MTEFLLGNSSILLFLLASGVMICTVRNWSSLPVLQRTIALQFLFITVHILEELRSWSTWSKEIIGTEGTADEGSSSRFGIPISATSCSPQSC